MKELPSPLAALHAQAQADAERFHGAQPVRPWRPRPAPRRYRGLVLVLGGAVALAASALAWHTPASAPVAPEPALPSAALHPAGLWAVVEGQVPTPVEEPLLVEARPAATGPAAGPADVPPPSDPEEASTRAGPAD